MKFITDGEYFIFHSIIIVVFLAIAEIDILNKIKIFLYKSDYIGIYMNTKVRQISLSLREDQSKNYLFYTFKKNRQMRNRIH